MREIKFRGWDTKQREMVTDIWIAPEYNWLVLADNDAMAERERPTRGQWKLMQFTGLHDKNGKQIYEGDIVSFASANVHIVDEVVWGSCAGWWTKKGASLHTEITASKNEGHGVEVIGNIYENPGLLT